MTGDERLAKAAEAEFAHGGYKSAGVGKGWLCWCDEPLSNWWPEGGVTPRDTALDYALRAHRVAALAPLLDEFRAEDEARALREAADERAGRKIAGEAADRFRDVLSECLGHPDENPGDDVLVAELREHFGKTGPEPRRWRDFLTGALARVDQINADRTPIEDGETA